MSGRNHGVGTNSVVAGRMRVRILPTTDPAIVGPTWRAVERRVGFNGLACSWEWTSTWLRHYGDLIPHRFVVGDADGPRAIALITEGVGQRRGPIPIRTLHLGTVGEPQSDSVCVEYNRLLVSRADRRAFSEGILRAIGESGLRGDELVLDGFVPEEVEPFLELDGSFTPYRRTCYVADLAAVRNEGGCVLQALRTHTAAKIRRSIRRLEEEHGRIRVEWAGSLDEARQMLDELVVLHQARWQSVGQPGSFASRRFAGFHREIVDRLFDAGHVLLARVSAGERTIGCDYGLVEHNRVLSYQWGLAQFEDRRLSPGLVTGAVVMQAALERGLDEYSWLAGDVLYKRELSTAHHELVWATAPRSARIHMVYGAARVKHLARRFGPLRTVAGAPMPSQEQPAMPTLAVRRQLPAIRWGRGR